ncbi:MAG: RNA 2'-phosphotransferase [Alphaproteobacteria bacterium]|nr:RNA 2'-phosphotransferase [Alphaproteobacteria bacterium]
MSRQSRYLSLVLRHKPEEIGLTLDAAGWARIDQLLPALGKAGYRMSRDELLALVQENDKKRFTISDDGAFIRAAQGHTVKVVLDLEARIPPEVLYHGTARRNLAYIFAQGLKSGQRQQVHLSADNATAEAVGRRHGKPVVLRVSALRMHHEGHLFFQADNGVWLTDSVPPRFLGF